MMPTYVTRGDGSREEAEEVYFELPYGLDVRTVVVSHGAVSFYDAENRESVLVQHGTYPGAGMDLGFADHVETKEIVGEAVNRNQQEGNT